MLNFVWKTLSHGFTLCYLQCMQFLSHSYSTDRWVKASEGHWLHLSASCESLLHLIQTSVMRIKAFLRQTLTIRPVSDHCFTVSKLFLLRNSYFSVPWNTMFFQTVLSKNKLQPKRVECLKIAFRMLDIFGSSGNNLLCLWSFIFYSQPRISIFIKGDPVHTLSKCDTAHSERFLQG